MITQRIRIYQQNDFVGEIRSSNWHDNIGEPMFDFNKNLTREVTTETMFAIYNAMINFKEEIT